MAYVDPDTIHTPATEAAAPASWGQQVRDNQVHFAEVADHNPATVGGGAVVNVTMVDTTVLDVVNTTTETSVASVTLAANRMQANAFMHIRWTWRVQHRAAPGDTLTARIKLGSTTIWDNTGASVLFNLNAGFIGSYESGVYHAMLYNAGATNSQKMTLLEVSEMGTLVSSYYQSQVSIETGLAAEDTTTALLLDFTVQWGAANAANSFVTDMVAIQGPFNNPS